MLAKDLMRRDVFTIRQDQSIEELIDLLVRGNIHGCPVVDAMDVLVGVVTQQDVFFSGVMDPDTPETGAAGRRARSGIVSSLDVIGELASGQSRL